MKSIRNILTALVAAGAVWTAASGMTMAGEADAPAEAHGWHHHGGPGHLLGKLGLSDVQKQQVKEIMVAAHEQMQAQRADVRAQVLKVLTPAQQTQLAALEAERQDRRHGE